MKCFDFDFTFVCTKAHENEIIRSLNSLVSSYVDFTDSYGKIMDYASVAAQNEDDAMRYISFTVNLLRCACFKYLNGECDINTTWGFRQAACLYSSLVDNGVIITPFEEPPLFPRIMKEFDPLHLGVLVPTFARGLCELLIAYNGVQDFTLFDKAVRKGLERASKMNKVRSNY